MFDSIVYKKKPRTISTRKWSVVLFSTALTPLPNLTIFTSCRRRAKIRNMLLHGVKPRFRTFDAEDIQAEGGDGACMKPHFPITRCHRPKPWKSFGADKEHESQGREATTEQRTQREISLYHRRSTADRVSILLYFASLTSTYARQQDSAENMSVSELSTNVFIPSPGGFRKKGRRKTCFLSLRCGFYLLHELVSMFLFKTWRFRQDLPPSGCSTFGYSCPSFPEWPSLEHDGIERNAAGCSMFGIINLISQSNSGSNEQWHPVRLDDDAWFKFCNLMIVPE